MRIPLTALLGCLPLLFVLGQSDHETVYGGAFSSPQPTVQLADGSFVRPVRVLEGERTPVVAFELYYYDSNGQLIGRQRPPVAYPTNYSQRTPLWLTALGDTSVLAANDNWECDLPFFQVFRSGPNSAQPVGNIDVFDYSRVSELSRRATGSRFGHIAQTDGNRILIRNADLEVQHAGRLSFQERPTDVSLAWFHLVNDSTLVGKINGSLYGTGVYRLTVNTAEGFPVIVTPVQRGSIADAHAQDLASRTVYYAAEGTLRAVDSLGQIITIADELPRGNLRELLFYSGSVGVWTTTDRGDALITRYDPTTGVLLDQTTIERPHPDVEVASAWWTADTIYLTGAATQNIDTEGDRDRWVHESTLNYAVATGEDYRHPIIDLSVTRVEAERTISPAPQEFCDAFRVTYDTLRVTLSNRGDRTIRSCDLLLVPIGRSCNYPQCNPFRLPSRRRPALNLAPGTDTTISIQTPFSFASLLDNHQLAVVAVDPNKRVDVDPTDNYFLTEVIVSDRPEPELLALGFWQDRSGGRVGLRNEAGRNLSVRLFDAAGRLIGQERGRGAWSRSTADLPSSVYFISVVDTVDGRTRTIRFVP